MKWPDRPELMEAWLDRVTPPRLRPADGDRCRLGRLVEVARWSDLLDAVAVATDGATRQQLVELAAELSEGARHLHLLDLRSPAFELPPAPAGAGLVLDERAAAADLPLLALAADVARLSPAGTLVVSMAPLLDGTPRCPVGIYQGEGEEGAAVVIDVEGARRANLEIEFVWAHELGHAIDPLRRQVTYEECERRADHAAVVLLEHEPTTVAAARALVWPDPGPLADGAGDPAPPRPGAAGAVWLAFAGRDTPTPPQVPPKPRWQDPARFGLSLSGPVPLPRPSRHIAHASAGCEEASTDEVGADVGGGPHGATGGALRG